LGRGNALPDRGAEDALLAGQGRSASSGFPTPAAKHGFDLGDLFISALTLSLKADKSRLEDGWVDGSFSPHEISFNWNKNRKAL
jgi:hypothetical protein